jgi:integrase
VSIYRRRRNGKPYGRWIAEFEFRNVPYRRAGFVDKDHAKHWLASETLRLRRGETGYVKALSKAQVVPLVTEFVAYLKGRGLDEMYLYTSEKRLMRLVAECGWVTLGNVTADSLEKWKTAESCNVQNHVKAGSRTRNQFLAIARQFGQWLRKPGGKLPSNPLEDVENLKAKHNDAYRRSATEAELNKLLSHCPPERYLAYLFVMYCPLRRNTIERLTWRMCQLDSNPPTITTPASINKSRKDEKHVIRHDIAAELRKVRKGGRGVRDDLVFPRFPSLDDLRGDLLAAGVTFDHGGVGRLDFHAIRRSVVRIARDYGVTLDDAGLLLGHKDSRTTRKFYADAADPRLAAAVEKLPALGKLRQA